MYLTIIRIQSEKKLASFYCGKNIKRVKYAKRNTFYNKWMNYARSHSPWLAGSCPATLWHVVTRRHSSVAVTFQSRRSASSTRLCRDWRTTPIVLEVCRQNPSLCSSSTSAIRRPKISRRRTWRALTRARSWVCREPRRIWSPSRIGRLGPTSGLRCWETSFRGSGFETASSQSSTSAPCRPRPSTGPWTGWQSLPISEKSQIKIWNVWEL